MKGDASARFVCLGEMRSLWAAPGIVRGFIEKYKSRREPDSPSECEYCGALLAIGPRVTPASLEAVSRVGADVSFFLSDCLFELGPGIVPFLVAGLDANETDTIKFCASLLGRFDSKARSALPCLKELLRHPDEWVKEEAFTSLTEIGGRDDLGGYFKRRFLSGSGDFRRRIGLALARYEEFDFLIEQSGNEDVKIRRAVATALRCVVDPAVAMPPLIRLMRDKDIEVRRNATESVNVFGSHAKPALDVLIEALQRPSDEVQDSALDTLMRLGPAARPALPAIVALLDGSDEWTTVCALRALRGIGAPKEVVPIVLSLLKREGDIAEEVLKFLGTYPSPSRSTVTAIAQYLERHPDDWSAADILAKFGLASAPAAPALIRSLVHDDDDYPAAKKALRAIGPLAERALVAAFEESSDDGVRLKIVGALGFLDTLGDAGFRVLEDAFRDPHDGTVASAVKAAGRMGPEARRLLPLLVERLQQGDSSRRSALVAAISRIAPKDRDTVVRLAHIVGDKENERRPTRIAAARGLVGTSQAPAAAQSALREALDDPVPSVRAYCALALLGWGQTGKKLDEASLAMMAPRVRKARASFLRSLRDTGVSDAVKLRIVMAALSNLPKDDVAVDTALELLRGLECDRSVAVPVLLAGYAARGRFDDREVFADVLADIGAEEVALDLLINAVRAPPVPEGDDDDGRDYGAVLVLGRLGSAARRAVPALEAMARSIQRDGIDETADSKLLVDEAISRIKNNTRSESMWWIDD